jgi:phage-related protein
MEVTVPPRKEPETKLFTPADFEEDTEQDTEQGAVTCPAGETSSYEQRNQQDTGTMYRFKSATCAACPLASQCLGPERQAPKGPFGRTVTKNDYEEEYRRARERAKTEAYEATRREHMKVERKLGEVMNRHGGRRAHYWGLPKVLVQELMACQATNVKRIIKLLVARECAQLAAE